MLNFLLAGGFPVVVIFALAAVDLYNAAKFFRAADPGRLAVVRSLNLAITWAIVVGVASNLMKVAWTVVEVPEFAAAPLLPLIQGFGESLVPAVIGGAVLSVSWILIGFGLRKMPHVERVDEASH
jgi:hypothetical protein